MTTIQLIPTEGIETITLHHLVYEAGDAGLLAEVSLVTQEAEWNTSINLNFSDLNEILAKAEPEDQEKMSEAISALISSDQFISMLETEEVLGHTLCVSLSNFSASTNALCA